MTDSFFDCVLAWESVGLLISQSVPGSTLRWDSVAWEPGAVVPMGRDGGSDIGGALRALRGGRVAGT